MLRPLTGSLSEKLVKIVPSLQQKRTVINLCESLTTGKSAVAIAFGSNLVSVCDLSASAHCYGIGSLVCVR